ncbi:GGDEF domain-containing protein [Devosia sp. Naph2]|uniref:GGDEF domain-containing protein n=1 Tax=Devosia polycyclovorans TaxID=3345148 RepID=UPI0035CF5269
MPKFARSPADYLQALRSRLLAYLLGKTGTGDPSAEPDIQKLISLVGIAVIIGPSFALYYAVVGIAELSIALIVSSIVMLSALFVYRVSRNLALARDYFLFSFFCYLVYCGYYFGNVASPTTFWMATFPVVGVLLGSKRAGIMWLALVLVFIAVLSGLTDGASPSPLPPHLYAMSLAGMIISIFLFVLMIDGARRRALANLEDANAAVTELARRDSLTGLYNRRYVWETLAREETYAQQVGESFSILLVDIDRFKVINDTFGHVTGDIVLKDVASVIQSTIGERDFCGRYGGEEFLVLLKGRQSAAAASCAEHIRCAIEDLGFGHVDGPQQVTASIGLACYEGGEAFTETFKRADQALYLAKGSGRNRVSIHQIALAS